MPHGPNSTTASSVFGRFVSFFFFLIKLFGTKEVDSGGGIVELKGLQCQLFLGKTYLRLATENMEIESYKT